ncbi:MAG: hypothetical protein ACI8W3_001138 [Myxococcota bacterium]|jgi:hypothetical protein
MRNGVFILADFGHDAFDGVKHCVDLDDSDSIRNSGASYLVAHFDLQREVVGEAADRQEKSTMVKSWKRRFGVPVYVDDRIAVLGLNTRGTHSAPRRGTRS